MTQSTTGTSGSAGTTSGAGQTERARRAGQATQPNVLVIFADQQRWDSLGVNGSPVGLTPNLDRLAKQGTRFLLPITNQPVCAPARACLLTGQYATQHGVWRNSIGLGNPPEGSAEYAGPPTLATQFAGAGYETGYCGKWHLAPRSAGDGWVPPQYRAGFQDFWEASNLLEFTSQPFETVLFDADGNEVRPEGYRVDAMTDRVIDYLRRPKDRPFFFMVSYLEPHHQNDVDEYVAPDEYTNRYRDAYVPADLRALPGSWQGHLPGYYGCIANLDYNVGRIVQTLEEQGLAENTIVVYTCDHGCHFKTRNSEYKRSCHDSSLRIPLVMWGPGFNERQVVPEPVGLLDLPPTLLDAAGVPVPETMQGHSLLPLVQRDAETVAGWQEEVFVQISESMVGRAIRNERWTYCITAPRIGGSTESGSAKYAESHLYDTYADPNQLVNLVGRRQYVDVASKLRARLVKRMVAAGEPAPEIEAFSGNAPP